MVAVVCSVRRERERARAQRERENQQYAGEGRGGEVPASLTLALGMRPLGPSTLAALPTSDIISGVATHRSKSMLPGFGARTARTTARPVQPQEG